MPNFLEALFGMEKKEEKADLPKLYLKEGDQVIEVTQEHIRANGLDFLKRKIVYLDRDGKYPVETTQQALPSAGGLTLTSPSEAFKCSCGRNCHKEHTLRCHRCCSIKCPECIKFKDGKYECKSHDNTVIGTGAVIGGLLGGPIGAGVGAWLAWSATTEKKEEPKKDA